MKKQTGRSAKQAAFVGVFSALSLGCLLFAAIVPSGRLGIVALSGVVNAAAVVSGGLPAGAFCYAVTGILGLLLSPDKGNALLYLLFMGVYPLVKYEAEQLKQRSLEWLCKLVFFNLMLSVFWFGLREVLLSALPPSFEQVGLLYGIGNLVFVLYDFGFSRVIAFYIQRIERYRKKR